MLITSPTSALCIFAFRQMCLTSCVWELANNHNQPIIRKFEAKLAKWKQRSLSMGGRITLINSDLSALPIYLLSMGGKMEAKKPIYCVAGG